MPSSGHLKPFKRSTLRFVYLHTLMLTMSFVISLRSYLHYASVLIALETLAFMLYRLTVLKSIFNLNPTRSLMRRGRGTVRSTLYPLLWVNKSPLSSYSPGSNA
ncbi:hypothetical protein V8F33_003714 [Rhypophila sp. PSN 637]